MSRADFPVLVVVQIEWVYHDAPDDEPFRRYFAGEGDSRAEAEADARRVAEEYVIGEDADVRVIRSRKVRGFDRETIGSANSQPEETT